MRSILVWYISCFGAYHAIVAAILSWFLIKVFRLELDRVGAVFFVRYFGALVAVFLLWALGGGGSCSESGMLAIISAAAIFSGLFLLILRFFMWLKNRC